MATTTTARFPISTLGPIWFPSPSKKWRNVCPIRRLRDRTSVETLCSEQTGSKAKQSRHPCLSAPRRLRRARGAYWGRWEGEGGDDGPRGDVEHRAARAVGLGVEARRGVRGEEQERVVRAHACQNDAERDGGGVVQPLPLPPLLSAPAVSLPQAALERPCTGPSAMERPYTGPAAC